MKYKTSAIAAAICLALTPTAFAGGDKTAPKADGSSAHSSMSSSASAETIRQAQQKLMDQGQNPGPIDGIMGPQTQAALKSYQEAKGMTASGNLDQQTMASLGVDASGKASGSTSSSPMGSGSTGRSSDSSSTGSTPPSGSTPPDSSTPSGSTSGSSTSSGSSTTDPTKDPTKPRN